MTQRELVLFAILHWIRFTIIYTVAHCSTAVTVKNILRERIMKNKSIQPSEPHFHHLFCVIVFDSGEMKQNKKFSYGTMRCFLQQFQSLKMFRAPNCTAVPSFMLPSLQ